MTAKGFHIESLLPTFAPTYQIPIIPTARIVAAPNPGSAPSHESGSSDAAHHHVHKHELFLDQDSLSSPTAIGVGVLHGIGVETPTQIAIFVATTQATGKAGGLLILVFWVVGLILANSAIALLSISANDWLRTHTVVYRVLAAIIGIVSVIVGILVLIEKDGILPAF